jgi:hypothetical protein
MAYIGKEPQVGNYIKLDAISTSSTNTYNLTKDSVAFTPESALHMLVSLNGVIQSPLSSFSVSGSTITFLPSSGTLSSSDTIDFILVLGNVLDIGTPSDSTVTNAKTNFASSSSSAGLQIKGDGTSSGTSGTLQLNCSLNTHGIKLASPAHTHGQNYTLTFPTTAPSADKALITDGSGNLSFGNVISEADMFRLTSDTSNGANADITANLERVDDATFSKIGTGMTESSGIFTFPSTGLYQVICNPSVIAVSDNEAGVITNVSSNSGGAFDECAVATGGGGGSAYDMNSVYSCVFVNVTNASTFQVKFTTSGFGGSSRVQGDTNRNRTSFSFIKLGASQ